MRQKKKINEFSVLSPEISVFLTVYELLSVNGAARKIGLDAGHVSRIIMRLEERLESKLFVRHQTGLTATPAGELYYAAASKARQTFSQQIASRSRAPRRIRIGFYSAVAFSHFPPRMVATLAKEGVEPEFTIATSLQLVEMIKKRELDLALCHSPVRFPGVVSRSIATEGIILCSKSGEAKKILLVHSSMLGVEKILQTLAYERRWVLSDYFVIARMLEMEGSIMGLIPETLRSIAPSLKVIAKYPQAGRITALSWPGSSGLELIRCISKQG